MVFIKKIIFRKRVFDSSIRKPAALLCKSHTTVETLFFSLKYEKILKEVEISR